MVAIAPYRGRDGSVEQMRRDVLREMTQLQSQIVTSDKTLTEAVADINIQIGTALDVNVRAPEYGAKGNGGTDDTSAFVNAASAARAGSQRLFVPRGHYRLTREINVSGLYVQLEHEAVLDFGGASSVGFPSTACLFASGSISDLPALNANVSAGDVQVVFAANHGMAVGDVFAVYDPTDFSFNPERAEYRAGEWCRVQSVTSDTEVMLDRPLIAGYVAATVTCHLQAPTTLRLEGGEVRGVGTSTTIAVVEVNNGQGVHVSNVAMSGTQWSHLHLERSVGCRVDDVRIRDYGPQGSTNYGVNINSCSDVIVTGCVATTRRHAVTLNAFNGDAGVPTRRVIVDGCVLSSDRNCPLDTHGACEFFIFSNCDLDGGVSLGGDHGIISSCRVTNRNNNGGRGVLMSEMVGFSLKFSDCDFIQTMAVDSGRGMVDWDGNSTSSRVVAGREATMQFIGCRWQMDGTGDDCVDIHYRDTSFDPDLRVQFVGCDFATSNTANVSRVLLRNENDRYAGVSFSACKFTGCRLSLTDDDLEFEDISVTDCSFSYVDETTAAVAIDGPTRAVLVHGCDFSYCRYGIQLGLNTAAAQSTRMGQSVVGNTFHDPPVRGVDEAMTAVAVYGDGAIISGNSITGLAGGTGSATTYAIRCRSTRSSIVGNRVTGGSGGNPWRAIACDGAQGGSQALSGDTGISDNIIDCEANGTAIYLENDNYSVRGNIIQDPGDYGILVGSTFLGHSIISNNVFRETAQSAEAIVMSSGERTLMISNIIDGFDNAIVMTTQASATRGEVVIRSNTITGHSGTAVSVNASAANSDFARLVIDDNTSDGGARGIRIQATGSSATVSRYKLGSGNDCTNATTNYEVEDDSTGVREGLASSGVSASDWTAVGWGTPTITMQAGSSDVRGLVTIRPSNPGISANPTLTLNFSDGDWPTPPFATVERNDTETPSARSPWTVSVSALTITFQGSPQNGRDYVFEYLVYE